MTSTIKVDNIQDQDGNNIINENANTITIGASGDTVTLASGASQTGFGRTGTVDWDTTAKTASFTAVSGNGYFVNTTSGAVTVTLPASPSAGDIVAVADYAGTAATNNITIGRNGSNFEGGTENGGISTNRQTATFVYVDGTQGWIVVNSNDASFVLPTFVTATGGTVTTCGNYKIHTFTGPGTFTVCSVGNPAGSDTVDYLVVAGGGAGANAKDATNGIGGGGGAGGYRESSGAASGCYSRSPLGACVSALPVSATGYPITVGAGGASSATDNFPGQGNSGSNSIFSSITSAGGGGGSRGTVGAGGSGGGAAEGTPSGAGNTPPVSPPQGNPGGDQAGGGNCSVSGGGGGATVAGSPGTPGGPAGPGGNGAASSINGTPTTRAGGGGGGGNCGQTGGGSGGSGGGGAGGTFNGGSGPTVNGTDGTTNTGGGGGATAAANSAVPVVSGGGGSGIVIIRYKFQ
jgi:hypothetical protein